MFRLPVRIHLRDKKGGDMAEWPVDLRVRQFPTERRALGVSVPYLNDILYGRRHLSDRFLAKLGLSRVVVRSQDAPS